jgi:hypothetical protein
MEPVTSILAFIAALALIFIRKKLYDRLSEKTSHETYHYPLDVVELVAQVLVILGGGLWLTVAAIFWWDASELKVVALLIMAVSLVLFISHLVRRKYNPHIVTPKTNILGKTPLAESIRTNKVYAFLSCVYLSYMILSAVHILPRLDQSEPFHSVIDAVIYICTAMFFGALGLYTTYAVKTFTNKVQSPNIRQQLISDSVWLVMFLTYFLFLWQNTLSLQQAAYSFGKILLGSISLLIIRDLYWGKK